MKTLTKIAVLVSALGAVLPALNAAPVSSGAAIAPSAQAPAEAHAKLRHYRARRHAEMHRLAHRLHLKADQVAQLKGIRQRTRAEIKGIRANTNLSPEQKRAQMRTAFQTAHRQMDAVLTPKQKTRLAWMKARRFGGL
jgi:Spy/CpxP family protein refolding chaperone